jgi:hypothetical protein
MSLLADGERPLIYGGLKEIQRKLGNDNFPLIPQIYYPSWETTTISPEMPFVLKVGWPHAGYGKIRVRQRGDFEDL